MNKKQQKGVKYDQDKDRWDLLHYPQIEKLVKVLTLGAKKYDDNNWIKVPNAEQRYQAALMRHFTAYVKGENILDLLDKGKNLDFFIVHGAKDNAVSVENARKAVQKLKELGISHKYVEVKDAYHTGYDRWGEIFGWLRSIVKPISEKKEK